MNKYAFILSFLILNMHLYGQSLMDFPTPPITKKSEQVDFYHGVEIKDPYRWLEDDNSQETNAWVNNQNEYAQAYLNKIPFKNQIKTQLTKMWDYEKYGQPFKKGDYYFFYKNNGLQNQSILYYQKGLSGEPSIFINPNTLNKEGTAALGNLSFSKNNKYCAYSVSQAGSDWQTIYVMDVKSKQQLSDSITRVKFSGASWMGDNGFYYSGYAQPDFKTMKFSAKTTFQNIYYHRIGTTQDKDPIVFEDNDHPLRYKSASLSEDEKWLILYQSEGTSGAEISYARIKKDRIPTKTSFKTLLPGFKYNYNVKDVIEGKFLVHTNHGADNYHLVLIDPNLPPVKNAFTTIVAEKTEKLDGVSLVGNHIFCKYLKDASSLILEYDLDGKLIREIDLPDIGTANGFGGDAKDDHTFYTFYSFNYAPTIFKYNIKTGKSELFKKPTLGFETNNIKVRQTFLKREDGTKIPMFIVCRDDLDLGGNKQHPTLMYGYGGFNISLTPRFSVVNSYFIQQGGIYVMVNLRGGSEYGEQWHKAGMLENKQNVFDDFISAAEYLINENITSSEKLAISGRSNGGLLVGACMTQRPDLFKVALPAVGVLDMLRYHKFTVGWGWVVEYGSADVKSDFKYLFQYSPLHNIQRNKNYPATMITTADHDDRVVPAHSFKFAATLQEKNTGNNPIFIRIDKQAGHGSGKPTSKIIDEWSDVLAFTMYHLGMQPKK